MKNFFKDFQRKLVNNNFMAKKKIITIRSRVEELVNTHKVPDDKQSKAIVAIMELIERAKSPDMFCPKCDTRMSIDLESGNLDCFNCGHKKKINISVDADPSNCKISFPPLRPGMASCDEAKTKHIGTEVEPNKVKPNKALLDAIDNAEKPAVITPKNGKKSILSLANNRGSGSKVTDEDEKALKNSVPGAKNSGINWS